MYRTGDGSKKSRLQDVEQHPGRWSEESVVWTMRDVNKRQARVVLAASAQLRMSAETTHPLLPMLLSSCGPGAQVLSDIVMLASVSTVAFPVMFAAMYERIISAFESSSRLARAGSSSSTTTGRAPSGVQSYSRLQPATESHLQCLNPREKLCPQQVHYNNRPVPDPRYLNPVLPFYKLGEIGLIQLS